MKRRVIWLSLVFLSVAFALAGSLPANAQEKVIQLKYSTFFPAPHKNAIRADQWCKEIEKRTNGRVKFSFFPGATLTPPAQTYDSVVKGIADVGESVLGYTRGKFPLTEVIDLPLGYKSGYVATKLINAYYEKFKPSEFSEAQVMFFHAHGPGIVHTAKKPVSKMEDLKGLKIRSHGLSAKVVQALGGTPVGMPMTETYDAIMKGVAEGVMCPSEAMKGWKLGEVVNYETQNFGSAYSTGFFVVMNKSRWNALPPDVQKIIGQVNAEFIEKQGKIWDEIDDEGRALMTKGSKKVIPLSKAEDARWAKQVAPVLEDYVKDAKAKGLPGDAALKFCVDYLRANQK